METMETAVYILSAICTIMAFSLYVCWVNHHFRKKQENRQKERELQKLMERVENLEIEIDIGKRRK